MDNQNKLKQYGLLLIGGCLLFLIITYVPSFCISIGIVLMLRPLLWRIETYLHVSKKWIHLIIVLVVYGLVFGSGLYLGYLFFKEVLIYVMSTDEYKYLFNPYAYHQYPMITSFFEQYYEYFQQMIVTIQTTMIQVCITCIKDIPTKLFDFFFIIFSSILVLYDYDSIKQYCSNNYPTSTALISMVISSCKKMVITTIKTYVLLFIVTCSLLVVGFMLLQVNHPIVLAIVLCFLDLLPIIGLAIIFLPWIGYAYFFYSRKQAIGLLVLYLTIVCSRQIVETKFTSSMYQIHPLLMLVTMYIGLQVAGIKGMIFASIMLLLSKLVAI